MSDLVVNGIKFHISDMSGKMSERRKWKTILDETPYILFFVSLDHCLTCEEESSTNRMMDSLCEWNVLLNDYDTTKLILVFTKNDMWKYNETSFLEIFPEFDGKTKPIDFIVDKFLGSQRIPHYIISTLNSKESTMILDDLAKKWAKPSAPRTPIQLKRRSSSEKFKEFITNIFKKPEVKNMLTSKSDSLVSRLDQDIETSPNMNQRYCAIKEIGSGGAGNVYLAENTETKETFVMKRIQLDNLEMMNKALNEVKFLYELKKHPNINTIIDFSIEKKDSFTEEQQYILVIITRFCEGGDLGNLILKMKKQKITFSEDTIQKYLKQIVAACKHIHEEGYRHSDLKPQNVFLDKEQQTVYIGDFGLTCQMVSLDAYLGTADYMAPEQAKNQYDQKSDVWAIGCILVDMLTVSSSTCYQKVVGNDPEWVSNRLSPVSDHYGTLLLDFAKKCLIVDPKDRPDCKRLLSMLEKPEKKEIPVKDWSISDVSRWLSKKGFTDLITLFDENQVDGKALILLEKGDLTLMGVKNIGILVKLDAEIKTLKSLL